MDVKIQVLDKKDNVYSVIEKITRSGEQDEAFYTCDVSELLNRYDIWKRLLPRVKIYYAVKCNDSRIVLETLAALGTGFDCASKEEIRRVLSLGVPPEDIIFANPTKKASHISYASKVGVSVMTFDNEAELYKTKKLFPTAQLLLRIKCDDVTAKFVLGSKFGAEPGKEAQHLLETARMLNLDVIGVAFHIGSGSTNFSIFAEAIAAAREVFDMGKALGYDFKMLDLGGGFPGKTATGMEEIARIVNESLEEHFDDLSVKVISEPGMYCCNTAFKLVANIHSKKMSTEIDKETGKEVKIRMYYVDVGIFGALIPVLYEQFFEIKPVKGPKNGHRYPSIVWGPTCDSSDKISDHVIQLPEMEIGDWMIFEEAGGYTLSISSEFNGFPTPYIHGVINEQGWSRLTKNVHKPMSEDRFIRGEDFNNCLTGLSDPYQFKTSYF